MNKPLSFCACAVAIGVALGTFPFAQPDVKAALQRTSFELLVGFNLTQDQLKYNATR